MQIMKNNLNEPFYYFDEVKDKYSLLFVNADRDEINPYTLKKMGFHVLSKYILSEKYESLREYFIDLLTKTMSLKFRISPEDIQMCRCIIRHCLN